MARVFAKRQRLFRFIVRLRPLEKARRMTASISSAMVSGVAQARGT
jgi:hypothetical protein